MSLFFCWIIFVHFDLKVSNLDFFHFQCSIFLIFLFYFNAVLYVDIFSIHDSGKYFENFEILCKYVKKTQIEHGVRGVTPRSDRNRKVDIFGTIVVRQKFLSSKVYFVKVFRQSFFRQRFFRQKFFSSKSFVKSGVFRQKVSFVKKCVFRQKRCLLSKKVFFVKNGVFRQKKCLSTKKVFFVKKRCLFCQKSVSRSSCTEQEFLFFTRKKVFLIISLFREKGMFLFSCSNQGVTKGGSCQGV